MGFLDLFRPKWRHSDAEVRARAIRDMGDGDDVTLRKVALQDPEARVRRLALKKLDDAETLLEVAAKDADEGLRKAALERAAELLLVEANAAPDGKEPAEGGDGGAGVTEEGCLEALRLIPGEARAALLEVARRAHFPAVRLAALARLSDTRAISDLARQSADPELRRRAVARLKDMGETEALQDLAVHSATPKEVGLLALEALLAPLRGAELAAQARAVAREAPTKDVALAALARLKDADLEALEDVAQRGKCKAARLQARGRLPAEAAAAPAPGQRVGPSEQELIRRARMLQLCRGLEAAANQPDLEQALREREEVAAGWQALQPPARPEEELARRYARAEAQITARQQAAQRRVKAQAQAEEKERARLQQRAAAAEERERERERERQKEQEEHKERLAERRRRDESRLVTLLTEAEALRGGTAEAERQLGALAREFDQLMGRREPDPLLTGRMEAVRARFAGLRKEQEERRRSEQEGAQRGFEGLLQRAEEAQQSDELKRLDRALKELREQQGALQRLPAAAQAGARERLQAVRDGLQRRLQELREVDDWKRWANVPRLETLVEQAEALSQLEDLKGVQGALRVLQGEWKKVGPAPKEKSEALWARFKAACDKTHERLRAHFAAADESRGENLKKKEELCQRAEALADSTDWKDAAAQLKQLQEQWKAIGPVPKEQSDAVWKRFRAACDKFFERRKVHAGEETEERTENLRRLEGLAGRAEALAALPDDKLDWKETAERLKRLQEEWKGTGPVPRDAREQADELWKRLRAACDSFFERRKAHYQVVEEARKEHLRLKVALCEQVEAQVESEEYPGEESLELVKRYMAEWKAIGPVPKDEADAVWRRFQEACDRLRERRWDLPVDANLGISRFENKLPLAKLAQQLGMTPPEGEGT